MELLKLAFTLGDPKEAEKQYRFMFILLSAEEELNHGFKLPGAYSSDREFIVSDAGPACESLLDESPTDEELQKYGCPELVESRATRFLCNLPDTELKRISDHDFSGVKFMLARLAKNEIERRRDV